MNVLAGQDDATIGQWILRRLGAPQVRVELTQDDLDDALGDARLWYASRRGVTRTGTLQVPQGNSTHTLPEDVDTVLNVNFGGSGFEAPLAAAGSWLLPGQDIPAALFGQANDGGIFSGMVQRAQYAEMGRRVMSADPDFRQEGRTLHLFAVSPSGTIRYEYKSLNVVIRELDSRGFDLLRRMALAKAKEKLGRARSKYDSAQTAAGSSQLDGQTLLQEAEAAMEGLNDEVMQAGYPLGIVIG